MAVQFAESSITRGVTEWLAYPEDIDVFPELNGRHEAPPIDWLIDSILKEGQIQPISIRKTAGRPVLTAGFSRWRAVSEINKKKLYQGDPLRLRCSYTAYDEKTAFLANIAENRVRNPTSPIDDAHNIARLINVYQMSEDEAADVYRASVSWVKGRLKLLELTPEAEKAVRSGRVAPSAAKAIAKMSKEHQKAVVAKQGKITAADVKREVPAPVKKTASLDLKPLASALFKGWTASELTALAEGDDEWMSVDRKKLLALYRAAV